MNNKQIKKCISLLNPITVLMLLPVSGFALAAVSMTNGNSAVINGPVSNIKGTQVVNINKPNANGLSHNLYSKFDVDNQGVILNNSQIGANTSLVGQIMGNSNLSQGTAKIILNEVRSSAASQLKGKVEVAGTKANVIIANPSGISCTGCGFINANNVTLTTGTPDIKNGVLSGYSVSKGTLGIYGNGLNSDSPTALLSRTVRVDGKVNATEIAVVAGNNYVNTNNQITGAVTGPNRGPAEWYNIDVSALGGMYANKISLVSDESSIGVRNQGQITAGNGGLKLSSKYILINTGKMNSIGNIDGNVYYQLTNDGGAITSQQSINLKVNAPVWSENIHGGVISATMNLNIDGGKMYNTDSKLQGLAQLNINTHNDVFINSGTNQATSGVIGGNVSIQTGTKQLQNKTGFIQANSLIVRSNTLDNTQGIININKNVDIQTTGDIINTSGLIRSLTGRIKLATTGGGSIRNGTTVQNSVNLIGPSQYLKGILAAGSNGGIDISAYRLQDQYGQIITNGDVNLKLADAINNQNGKISSIKKLTMQANALDSSQGSISSRGGMSLDIKSGNIILN